MGNTESCSDTDLQHTKRILSFRHFCQGKVQTFVGYMYMSSMYESPLVPSLFYFREQLFLFSRAVIYIFKSSYMYFNFEAALFLTFLKQLFDFRKPSSSMAAAVSDARSLHLIRRYLILGLNYDEIIASLASNHNIFISKHNLNRKLRELCLYCLKQPHRHR